MVNLTVKLRVFVTVQECKEGLFMRRITTISTTLIVFLGLLVACGNNDEGATNFFEENRNEWPELTVIEDQIGSDFEEVNVENDKGNSRYSFTKMMGMQNINQSIF